MKRIAAFGLAAIGAAAAAILATVQPAASGDSKGLHVVELFTSQSCYSCPPAEKFLGELAERDDLVALEFHVDYWDDLTYGSAGKWKDVFSDPAFTERQRGYAGSIRGSQTYTPQMVIDGRFQAVGSNRSAVLSAIREGSGGGQARADIALTAAGGAGAEVTVSGTVGRAAQIWLVRYELRNSTVVRAGENKGKTLTNHNVVRAVDWVGGWNGGSATYRIEDLGLAANQGCAVIVQAADYGPIVGVAKCPAAPGA